MKRTGNIYERIYNMDNLILADKNARKGNKRNTYGVRLFDKDREANLLSLQEKLERGAFSTSEYKVMTIIADKKKEREIWKLPYFPDRILHHAIIQVIEPYLVNHFINDTYACVKGKGLLFGVNRVKRAMIGTGEGAYCLKTDIKKFYPSINQDVMIEQLKRMFKDSRFISLMSEIIHSTPHGLPIGLYTSQPLANYYLSGLDHYIKESLKVKHYFRYCDDMVFLLDNKEEAARVYKEVEGIASAKLGLSIKPNYRLFPLSSAPVDFLGYQFYKEKTLLRKEIKKRFAKKYKETNNRARRTAVLGSYNGWCVHGDCVNLFKTITGMKNFSELGIKNNITGKDGKRFFDVETKSMMDLLNQEIIVRDFETGVSTKNGADRYAVLVSLNGTECKFITNNYRMKDTLDQCKAGGNLPFKATLKRKQTGTVQDYYFI